MHRSWVVAYHKGMSLLFINTPHEVSTALHTARPEWVEADDGILTAAPGIAALIRAEQYAATIRVVVFNAPVTAQIVTPSILVTLLRCIVPSAVCLLQTSDAVVERYAAHIGWHILARDTAVAMVVQQALAWPSPAPLDRSHPSVEATLTQGLTALDATYTLHQVLHTVQRAGQKHPNRGLARSVELLHTLI